MRNLGPINFQAGIRLRRLCFDPQTDLNPLSMENVTNPIIFFNDQAEDANQFLYIKYYSRKSQENSIFDKLKHVKANFY